MSILVQKFGGSCKATYGGAVAINRVRKFGIINNRIFAFDSHQSNLWLRDHRLSFEKGALVWVHLTFRNCQRLAKQSSQEWGC